MTTDAGADRQMTYQLQLEAIAIVQRTDAGRAAREHHIARFKVESPVDVAEGARVPPVAVEESQEPEPTEPVAEPSQEVSEQATDSPVLSTDLDDQGDDTKQHLGR